MLLQPHSLELDEVAPQILPQLDGDPRFKLELPASQLEIVTTGTPRIDDVATELLDARRRLVERTDGIVMLAAAGAHPFSSGLGELNRGSRYERTVVQYAGSARRQLVCALQVHVGVGSADRALAVYNAGRSYLPLLAALAANAPFYEGRDTGLASVRPALGKLLPHQGVPPAFGSWERYADALSWGASSQTFPDGSSWWWELRPHPRFGTLEFRVPDGQSTVADAIAVAAVIQALVAWLGARHDAGERVPADCSWRIEENRWSACRHGVEGAMVDLHSGTPRSTRACLYELLDVVEPFAKPFESERGLAHARAHDRRQRSDAAAARRTSGRYVRACPLAGRALPAATTCLATRLSASRLWGARWRHCSRAAGRMFHDAGAGTRSNQRTDDPWFKLAVLSADS